MILSILQFIFILAEVIVLFNLLIIVHELGHFWAARWRGVVVERFGIWFGKAIWKKTIDGVEYRLGCIPAGGFVALPQLGPMESIEGENKLDREQLPPIKPLDKIIVAFAGPLFSFGLAFLMAVMVWMIGRPVSNSVTTTTIGYIDEKSPAAAVGIQVGDRILSINGNPVRRFGGVGDSVEWQIVSSTSESLPVVVERQGVALSFQVEFPKEEKRFWERPGLKEVPFAGALVPMIANVFPNGPAQRAGLKPNDQIVELDGQKLLSPLPVTAYMEAHPGQPVPLLVKRGDTTFATVITPQKAKNEEKPKLGIEWDLVGETSVVHPNPLEQIKSGVDTMVYTLGALFTPKSDIKAQHLSGPVGILRLYYALFEHKEGWRQALWFSVVLNINLAILNLVPLPVLDGGHIVLAFVEWLRGRPLSLKVLEVVQSGCAIVLIGYILFVSFYDVQDWRTIFRPKKKLEFEVKTDTAS
jgi:regulator of sigma E protease